MELDAYRSMEWVETNNTIIREVSCEEPLRVIPHSYHRPTVPTEVEAKNVKKICHSNTNSFLSGDT